MHRLLMSLIACTLAAPALADGPPFLGQTPPQARLAAIASPDTLRLLVTASVMGQNCPGQSLSWGEFYLLSRSEEAVVAALGLSVGAHEDDYFRPAFALLATPDGCARNLWTKAKALGWLIGLGGATGE